MTGGMPLAADDMERRVVSQEESRPGDLGKLIKRARKERHLSLRDVAERSGLSASFIGQVERSETSPSLRSVRGLIDALGVKLSGVFEKLEAPPGEASPHVISQDKRKKIHGAIAGVDIYLLTTPKDRALQASLMFIQAGATSGEQAFHHEGEEVGYILVGSLSFRIETNDYALKTGDCISFKSSSAHSWKNDSGFPCVALWVSTPVNY